VPVAQYTALAQALSGPGVPLQAAAIQ
jgi:hypothetical protein